jgi:hypothetical protein
MRRSLALTLPLIALYSGVIWGQTSKPVVNSVANVASYGTGAISPGEMIVIFGTGRQRRSLSRSAYFWYLVS